MLRRAVDVHESVGAAPYVVLASSTWPACCWRTAPRRLGGSSRRPPGTPGLLDMPGAVTRADRLLGQAVPAPAGHDPLSPREREIVALVVAVRSNREIAEQLVISERTVETHVRSVLAKTGCTNRTELVARRDELGLVT